MTVVGSTEHSRADCYLMSKLQMYVSDFTLSGLVEPLKKFLSHKESGYFQMVSINDYFSQDYYAPIIDSCLKYVFASIKGETYRLSLINSNGYLKFIESKVV